MSRKALPKVIIRPADEIEAITTKTAKERTKPRKSALVAAEPSTKTRRNVAKASPAREQPAAATPAPESGTLVTSAPNPPAPAPSTSVAPAPADHNAAEEHLGVAATIEHDPQVIQRRQQANKIVERYQYYAAAGGLLPVPVVNVAGVTAINMRMAKVLSDLYGVPFERDWARSTMISFIGGAASSGLGVATASTFAMLTPVGGLVGLAVTSFSAAALTRGLGAIFIERFETAVQNPDPAAARPLLQRGAQYSSIPD